MRRKDAPGSLPSMPPELLTYPPGVDQDEVQGCEHGVGPLFHRLYGTRVRGSTMGAEELMAKVQSNPNRTSPTKFARFHATLHRYGATRPLPDPFERLESWNYVPLSSSDAIAAEIARRWLKRRRMLGAPPPAHASEA